MGNLELLSTLSLGEVLVCTFKLLCIKVQSKISEQFKHRIFELCTDNN